MQRSRRNQTIARFIILPNTKIHHETLFSFDGIENVMEYDDFLFGVTFYGFLKCQTRVRKILNRACLPWEDKVSVMPGLTRYLKRS